MMIPLAQLSDNAIMSIVFGTLTVLGAAGSSYLATRILLATLVAKVDSLSAWLEKVSEGKTERMGRVETRLDRHDTELSSHHQRITHIELEHARFRPRREEEGAS